MEAKDTLIKTDEIEKISLGFLYPSNIETTIKLLDKQAEVSFKAGIKEVVEWINNNWYSAKFYAWENNCMGINAKEWQDKLKEWGIKPSPDSETLEKWANEAEGTK
jgi:hypothetical protein